tara:strand:- start:167 stop:514 length:348 start_codon:yes stop_codon:yes gene_type:complete
MPNEINKQLKKEIDKKLEDFIELEKDFFDSVFTEDIPHVEDQTYLYLKEKKAIFLKGIEEVNRLLKYYRNHIDEPEWDTPPPPTPPEEVNRLDRAYKKLKGYGLVEGLHFYISKN